jgi:uncharacterized protein (DUF2336 family)
MAGAKKDDKGRRRLDQMSVGDSEYEAAKQLARDKDPVIRRKLARRADLRPELLYYLAEDPDASVRREIAANAGAPGQADLLLARDADVEVRSGLAQKIVRVAPQLDVAQQSAARKLTVEVLTVLAQDQMTHVRRILSEALKDVAHAPPAVIRRLAQDREIAVAGPVLQFSPLLTDADLLAIIASKPVGGALGAISRRAGVRAPVVDAVVAAADRTGDDAAITALLANSSAQIREETLDHIIDRAPDQADWHEPLVRRPKLSARAVTRLAQFVADSLIERLQSRADLDPATAEAVAAAVHSRLEGGGAAAQQTLWEAESSKAAALNEQGMLGEAQVVEAIATGNRNFVVAALAVRSGLPEVAVTKVLSSRAAKAVVATVWKAGMSMSLAYQIQLRMAGIAPDKALKPGEGGRFPLGDDDLAWQVDLLQAQKGRKQ